MVGFLFIQVFIHLRVATHSGWLKTPDLGQKGACNQGKEDFKQLTSTAGCTPHPRLLERMFSSGSNYRFRRKWVSAPFGVKGSPLGLRGRTPYKAHSTLCVSLLKAAVRCGTVRGQPLALCSAPFLSAPR